MDYTFGKLPALPVKMVFSTALNRNWSVEVVCDKVSSYDTHKIATLIPVVRKAHDYLSNRENKDVYRYSAFDSQDDALSL